MNSNTNAARRMDWRTAVVAMFVLVAGLLFGLSSRTAHAAPLAGTVIGNQATATYTDATATSRNATSNLVQTTVAQVKSFTLTADGARTAAPGQPVYYPHTLTNSGNGSDTYAFTAPVSGNFGVAGPHTAMGYFLDSNGDGVPEGALTTPVTLAPGAVLRFVMTGTVPASAANASTATLAVTVTDTAAQALTNTDTTTVANSVISVAKSLSSSSGAGGTTVTVTLGYTNSGTAVANSVTILDTLPANMVFVAGSGRWSVSGASVLTEANDGFEQGVTPVRIDFRMAANAVTAIVESVPAGQSGNVRFDVTIPANLAPQAIPNTATYSTATQASTSTNTATYTVIQSASVTFNGANNNSSAASNDPQTQASAGAGATVTFNNYVWNLGNGTDTFDVTVDTNSFPAGSIVTLQQQDGATSLINSGGGAAPDTGPVPGRGAVCNAPFVTDGTFCGYQVVVRVTLPAGTTGGGPYSLTLRATSAFNNALFETATDTLTTIAANTVDVTNDVSVAGGALAADGLGATGATIIRTNTVTPTSGASTTTRFRIFVNNTGAVADSFVLSSTFAATTAAGVTAPTLPAGWSVAFFADGGLGTCATTGGALGNTGPIAVGANRLVCAEVTVPTTVSGGAIPGQYDFDMRATSQTNGAVTDVKRDRVVVNTVRLITLTPNNTQQTFPGGSVTYSHTITNAGNIVDTAAFAASCLTDSRSAQGWTSTAYIDTNANGLEVGVDPLITCGATNQVLNVGQSFTIFVRVFAPAGATGVDPANITTLTATYSVTVSATDTTSVTDGLLLLKEQQAVGVAGCAVNNPAAGSYTNAAIAAGPSTVPGACIAYRITATNTTAGTITSVVINDLVPANTRMHYACSGNGVSNPSVTVGAIAGTTPLNGATGTVTANVGTLTSTQSAVLYFCVRIDP